MALGNYGISRLNASSLDASQLCHSLTATPHSAYPLSALITNFSTTLRLHLVLNATLPRGLKPYLIKIVVRVYPQVVW